ncbi:carboxyl transferase domain-containing protein [Pseudonocardia parietis]|uniref:Acetyl-CoA carboxylase carboxyl transferase subunit beta n=1 Tax=Pseudonocardia parietis TaxID=570936 RepID=A0ABS4VL64_9PSEU|nr:carboxyl transferase domain-containing protein [Pseudonocardia parietis]MBP2364526.1 acetyl-CoA carboxylase carboxyl transferase subunit beta [Pseudonocardia parietis]
MPQIRPPRTSGEGGAVTDCVRPGSTAYLDAVLDPGSFRAWTTPAAPPVGADAGYRAELIRARADAGTDESVVTGEGSAGGERLAVVCSEFGFLAGSVGTVAAARIVTAVERATAARLPLLLAPASGGTRMQEGTAAFLAMIEIADRVAAHRRAGLPVVVHLRHPTTGGAFASWGSLGSLTFAEPGALVGFLGPRVYRELHGAPFPPGVQTGEHLHERGLVDAVLTADELAPVLRRILALIRSGPSSAPPGPASVRSAERRGLPRDRTPDAWTSITATRRTDRPGVRALLAAVEDTVELRGTGAGETAAATVLCLARFGASACVLAGQDRSAGRAPGPADLRVVRRAAALARELRLPLVTVIDTAGAELSPAAEEGGLAGEIARCLAELADLPVPVVSVLLGQGGGGAALALLPADRVLAARNAWLTPLPPEGASAIVHGTAERAAEVVADQRVRSADLAAHGVVDRIVEECPDAADEPDAFAARVAAALAEELPLAAATGGTRRLGRRRRD